MHTDWSARSGEKLLPNSWFGERFVKSVQFQLAVPCVFRTRCKLTAFR